MAISEDTAKSTPLLVTTAVPQAEAGRGHRMPLPETERLSDWVQLAKLDQHLNACISAGDSLH